MLLGQDAHSGVAMTGLPTWTTRAVPAHARLALTMISTGATVFFLALAMPYGGVSNAMLTLGSFAVAIGLLLWTERAIRLRSDRRSPR